MNIQEAKQLLSGHSNDPLIQAVDVILGSVEFDSYRANNSPELRGRDRHFNAGRSSGVADARTVLRQVARGDSKLA